MSRALRNAVRGMALCVVLMYAVPTNAQVTTAEILGTVTDSTGAIIPGAEVTIRNLGTGLS